MPFSLSRLDREHPRRIDGFALCVLRRMEPLLHNGTVHLLDCDTRSGKVGTLVDCSGEHIVRY
jgi:hypothetical protein